ncbi:MAG: metallophosphoesterase family protein [Paracoccaceae bacterium]
MDKVIYAIGDVHGRDDLLSQLHNDIRAHHQLLHSHRGAELVYVGDYIDRGPDSAAVIDRAMAGLDRFQSTCLLGNHEAMMLECLDTDNQHVWTNWLFNGGEETLLSLGVSPSAAGGDPKELTDALGPDRVAWLKALALSYEAGPYLFVHAGIVPNVPLDQQQPQDLLWIRSRFLDSNVDHGRMVIHGHTPSEEPVVKHNRICIDTGAAFYGQLTAVVLDGDSPPLFLQAQD